MAATSGMWVVRAGEGGAFVEDFLSNSLVAIGWRQVGEVQSHVSDEELDRLFRQAYPTTKEHSRKSGFFQVRRFLREPAIGDSIATYDASRRLYLLGTIAGGPEWRNHPALPRLRRVKWTHQVLRDVLSVGARNSLGSTLTLFRLDDDATTELLTKAVPLGAALPPASSEPAPTEDKVDETQVLQDAEKQAQEFVEDRLARLDWRQMQELVAAILRAMGYKTAVAEEGPDRGIDIFASPDGLGLQEPRIFVEVKHRPNSQMGAQELRAFLGGRKPGDRCLYVSTGGFSKDAKYEAERSTIPLSLLTLAEIRKLLLDHYDRLDPDAKALVPLRRIYLPAPE